MADEDRQGIGARIAAARREAGLTQRELADRLGVTTRSIQNYESGSIIPYKHLRRIEMQAHKSVGWILSGEGRDEDVTASLARLEQALERHHALLREHLATIQRQTELLRKQRERRARSRASRGLGAAGREST
jgi:transcriptional regulator with XRE-family HTH domain